MERKIVWLVVSLLVVAALVLASCGPAVPEEEEVAPVVEEEKVEDVPFEKVFSIGETARTSQIAITVLEATFVDSYEYYSKTEEKTFTKEAKPDMTFLVLNVSIKNIGSAVTREGLFQMRAYDSEVDWYWAGPYFGEGRIGVQDKPLEAGEEMTGKLAFEVQKGASDLTFIYNCTKYPKPELLAEWKIK